MYLIKLLSYHIDFSSFSSPGATSLTLLEQARRLIKLLDNDRDKTKWKLVTILMGHNDICTNTCNITNTQYLNIRGKTEYDASPG